MAVNAAPVQSCERCEPEKRCMFRDSLTFYVIANFHAFVSMKRVTAESNRYIDDTFSISFHVCLNAYEAFLPDATLPVKRPLMRFLDVQGLCSNPAQHLPGGFCTRRDSSGRGTHRGRPAKASADPHPACSSNWSRSAGYPPQSRASSPRCSIPSCNRRGIHC